MEWTNRAFHIFEESLRLAFLVHQPYTQTDVLVVERQHLELHSVDAGCEGRVEPR